MYNTDLPSRAELPSTRKLLRSTFVAALIATGLLVITILPAEYGIDPTGIGHALGLTQMGEIKVKLATESDLQESSAIEAKVAKPAGPASVAGAITPLDSDRVAPLKQAATTQQHAMSVELKPGQGAEIKLVMRKGVRVNYEWSAQGGLVNYDTHGDPVNAPKNFYHGYGKGQNEKSDAGVLEAAFDGKHGWFWRNRSSSVVTVTLKTSGSYEKIERVI